jgi:hypothetical protein
VAAPRPHAVAGALGKGREAGCLVRDLKTIFEALAELYAQLISSGPGVEILQHMEAKFGAAFRTFAGPLCVPDKVL